MCELPSGAVATTSSTSDHCGRCRRRLTLVLSAEQIRSCRRIVAIERSPHCARSGDGRDHQCSLEVSDIRRGDGRIGQAAVRDVAKAFEQLVPTSVLKDRALAIAIELRHPAYDCFYLALAERSTSPLVTADDRLIRRCANTAFEKLVQSL